MKTRRYLDEVLGSKSRIAVLRTLYLYPWHETTPLQIAKKAKGSSRTPVLKAVKQLEATGIITMKSLGHAFVVKLNQEHVAYPVLDKLFKDEGNSWAEFRKELKALVPRGTLSCVLFGSVMRGEESGGSDVDLLLIVPDHADKEKIVESLPTFLESFDLPLSWHVYTQKEFKKKQNIPLMKSLRKQYDVIKGDDPWPNQRRKA